jgi:hypothetical protein
MYKTNLVKTAPDIGVPQLEGNEHNVQSDAGKKEDILGLFRF